MERPGVKKKDIVAQLLLRKEGCTVAEVLAATGWTKVGMPTMAEAAGLKLRKVKDADTTRYFGSK
jgi:riboflavin synthase